MVTKSGSRAIQGWRCVGRQRPRISAPHFTEEGTGAQRGAGTCSSHPARPGRARARTQVSPRPAGTFPDVYFLREGRSRPPESLAPQPGSYPRSPPHTLHTTASASGFSLWPRVSRTAKGARVLRQSVRRFTRTFRIICADRDRFSHVKGDL